MTDHPDETWRRVMALVREAVPENAYLLWFDRVRLREITPDALVLEAPDHVARWLNARFGRVLQTCAAAVLGPGVDVEVVGLSGASTSPVAPGETARRRAGGRSSGADFVPRYRFEDFVIGEGNRLAHAASLAVAEQPGQAYNPLFIYGPPGVGKTHLLHSMAGYVAAHAPGLAVRYTTVESFTNSFVSALQTRAVDRFKATYRGVDLLLIDDVQFLADKARTEEEFFHTFNALYEAGSQLVFTSDRLPRDIGALEGRLRERFESGLVADISAPDVVTRMAILRKRAQADGLAVSPQVLEVIAERVPHNVRALEGALVRVIAFHSLHEQALTPELAAHVLDRLYPRKEPARTHSVRDIQQAACRAFGLTIEELTSASRSGRVAWPRQLAMYLAREMTNDTLPSIGRAFGGRDHTTVLYACRRAATRIAADPAAHDTAQALTARLRAVDRDRSG